MIGRFALRSSTAPTPRASAGNEKPATAGLGGLGSSEPVVVGSEARPGDAHPALPLTEGVGLDEAHDLVAEGVTAGDADDPVPERVGLDEARGPVAEGVGPADAHPDDPVAEIVRLDDAGLGDAIAERVEAGDLLLRDAAGRG